MECFPHTIKLLRKISHSIITSYFPIFLRPTFLIFPILLLVAFELFHKTFEKKYDFLVKCRLFSYVFERCRSFSCTLSIFGYSAFIFIFSRVFDAVFKLFMGFWVSIAAFRELSVRSTTWYKFDSFSHTFDLTLARMRFLKLSLLRCSYSWGYSRSFFIHLILLQLFSAIFRILHHFLSFPPLISF